MKKIIFVSLAAILVFHLIALKGNWYYSVLWLDIPMHLLGGAWVALFFLYFFGKAGAMPQNRLAVFIFGLGFVILTGVLWEFYEFLTDVFILKTHSLLLSPPGLLSDTLDDLFNDLLGGAAILGLRELFASGGE